MNANVSREDCSSDAIQIQREHIDRAAKFDFSNELTRIAAMDIGKLISSLECLPIRCLIENFVYRIRHKRSKVFRNFFDLLVRFLSNLKLIDRFILHGTYIAIYHYSIYVVLSVSDIYFSSYKPPLHLHRLHRSLRIIGKLNIPLFYRASYFLNKIKLKNYRISFKPKYVSPIMKSI